MRIVIAMMKHETNTFSPVVTDWARFEAWGAYVGEAVRSAYVETRMPIAAYMALARERGAEIVTPLAAEAMPAGPVCEDAYERMAGLVCDAVAGGCDVALLDLHGAMVAEHVLDGEGELLRRVRDLAPDLPIAVTCDLHCNLTDAMVENCTALIGYKTYPHVDMYEVAEQIGRVVLNAVDGRTDPVVSWGRAALLSQTLCQGTGDEPMRSLIAMCREAEARAGVLAATTFGGFALADVPDAGSSAVVVTDGDRRLADEIRDGLLERIRAEREAFIYRHRPIEEALDEARAFDGGPVVLLDHADNCGSGATQDVMTAIEAVMRAGLDDVIVGQRRAALPAGAPPHLPPRSHQSTVARSGPRTLDRRGIQACPARGGCPGVPRWPWLYVLVTLEFQSTVDSHMAVRMLTHTGLLYQDLIHGGELGPDGRLPPVLPIVLYNGRRR